MMNSNSVLFVGCGDLGIRTGLLLLEKGWQVAGLRRDPALLPAGFAPYPGDYTRPGSLDFIADLRPAHVVASFNPAGRSLEGYQRGFTQAALNLRAALLGWRPQTLLMISSTRVFAETDGGWVDESSPLASEDERALAIIAAEQALVGSADCVSAVRFGGIYGAIPGRLLEKVRRGELSPLKPERYSNRIHRDDCAGLLAHLLQLSASGTELAPVYIGVDDLPAPQAEVETWLAQQLGVASDAQQSADTVADGGSADLRMSAGHKRCRNRQLHASGYRLRYPDYRAGYQAMLDAGA
jgi:hypothetical protein